MSLKKVPEFQSFLAHLFFDSDSEKDDQNLQAFLLTASSEKHQQLYNQGKAWVSNSQSLTEELGMEANRWFTSEDEARAWIEKILNTFSHSSSTASSTAPSTGSVKVKDSNGALLTEGDSVTVIKDLKVKGGSSDLKRGTLIKKIRLIDDPENIECNVDGSTLILKTCFLKKA